MLIFQLSMLVTLRLEFKLLNGLFVYQVLFTFFAANCSLFIMAQMEAKFIKMYLYFVTKISSSN